MFKEPVLKTGDGATHREFESHTLRQKKKWIPFGILSFYMMGFERPLRKHAGGMFLGCGRIHGMQTAFCKACWRLFIFRYIGLFCCALYQLIVFLQKKKSLLYHLAIDPSFFFSATKTNVPILTSSISLDILIIYFFRHLKGLLSANTLGLNQIHCLTRSIITFHTTRNGGTPYGLPQFSSSSPGGKNLSEQTVFQLCAIHTGRIPCRQESGCTLSGLQ